MPVALEHDRLSVGACGERAGLEDARIAPQAHRPSLVGDVALLGEQIDHGMRRERVEFGGVRVLRAERRARELDDHALHAHAEAQRGEAALATEAGRLHLALDPAVPEAARHHEAVEADERLDVVRALEALAVDPFESHVTARGPGCVADRLRDREVRIGQLDVLPDEPDGERHARSPDALGERLPFGEIRLPRLSAEAELLDDDPAEAGVLEHERDAVDRPGVRLADDIVDLDVAEERDLLAQLVVDRLVRSRYEYVGLDADRP